MLGEKGGEMRSFECAEYVDLSSGYATCRVGPRVPSHPIVVGWCASFFGGRPGEANGIVAPLPYGGVHGPKKEVKEIFA